MKSRTALGLTILLAATAMAQTVFVPGGTVGNSNNGNVGIGSPSPGSKLALATTATNDGISIYNAGGTWLDLYANLSAGSYNSISQSGDRALIYGGASVGNPGGGFVIAPWASTTSGLRLDASGNVGIGTSTPSAPLQVGASGVGNQLLKVGVSGNMANSNAEILGSLAVLAANTNSYSVLGATAGNYYNAGNSPSWSGTLLEYWGTSYPGNVYGLAAANQGTLVFQNVSSGVIASNGANIYISPLGNVSTTFLTNGNVGIGTTNPTYPLSVNGTVRAKEVIVDTGWSDYVFTKDYKLAPLSEVEEHIKTEQHLPGIPSAREVAEKGISIGEVQAKLLAKIEELTLHVIAQEKEIKALQAEVAKSQNK